MLEINKIYNEDCIEGMKKIDTSSIDCVICDLPYYKVVKDDFDNQWKSVEDYMSFIESVTEQYARILKPNANIFLFTSRQMNRHICDILDRHFTEKRIIIWARKRGFNNTRGQALASGYEPISYYCNGDKGTYNNIKIKPGTDRPEYKKGGMLENGVSLSDLWMDIPALPHNAKEKTGHPTQKPIALIRRIIQMGTNEGDLVLDNCMGSGTTAIACMMEKRNFIGFELDRGYYEIAQERLKTAGQDIAHTSDDSDNDSLF